MVMDMDMDMDMVSFNSSWYYKIYTIWGQVDSSSSCFVLTTQSKMKNTNIQRTETQMHFLLTKKRKRTNIPGRRQSNLFVKKFTIMSLKTRERIYEVELRKQYILFLTTVICFICFCWFSFGSLSQDACPIIIQASSSMHQLC